MTEPIDLTEARNAANIHHVRLKDVHGDAVDAILEASEGSIVCGLVDDGGHICGFAETFVGHGGRHPMIDDDQRHVFLPAVIIPVKGVR